MFKLNNNKIKSDLPLITDNFQILHFDEEPILFSGSNKYGNKIIGSLIDDDDYNKFSRYFYSIIDSKSYFQFINQKITYRDLLKNYCAIYIVDKSFTNKILDIYKISFEDIPQEYIPLKDSYCPKQYFHYGFNFIISLQGKLANMNEALPKEISSIQNTFSKLLSSPIECLKGLNLNPCTHQLAYSEGSFKLNFKLGINKENDFFIDDDRISKFLNQFFEYCINNLPDEVDLLFNPSKEIPKNFNLIMSEINEIYQNAVIQMPDNVNNTFKNEIEKTIKGLQQISENIGENFSEIEIFNKFIDTENPIGFIDNQFKTDSINIIEKIDMLNKEILIDKEPKVYKICIYHLNTKSRIGNALIFNEGSDSEMSKPNIKILGDDPLEETKFTESLYKNKWIEVYGIAKKVNRKFKSIDLLYE